MEISIFSKDRYILLYKLWYQIYIYTEGSIDSSFFNETFLVKGKREILKDFFLRWNKLKWNTCVISSDPPFIEWHVRCTFEIFISPSFLKQEMARVTFVEKPQIKIIRFQNGKHGCLMQYLIRQSFEGYCCESEYILILFLIF